MSKRRIGINLQSIEYSQKERRMGISAIDIGMTALLCKSPLGILTIALNYLKLTLDQRVMATNLAITLLHLEASLSTFYSNMILNSMYYSEFRKMFRLSSADFLSVVQSQRNRIEFKGDHRNNLNCKCAYF